MNPGTASLRDCYIRKNRLIVAFNVQLRHQQRLFLGPSVVVYAALCVLSRMVHPAGGFLWPLLPCRTQKNRNVSLINDHVGGPCGHLMGTAGPQDIGI
ncbi:hypothetical protein BDN72DRAFT_284140 [Pluteus cervinus]|uniref:Uncharacterized protein n=1 Tax=Pluteus cervinus TaxID=181527 RepID=A0ACD3B495_9AGAR|nr:hypothetical protein BDN72DRAFT_284140 [Pluteus cervinus]